MTVTAVTLLRDLLLQVDRLHPDARTDRGLVTLLPDESVVYRVDRVVAAFPGNAAGALACVNSRSGQGAPDPEPGRPAALEEIPR